MSFQKLLIANRGEIAIRITRAAGETGLATVAIYPPTMRSRCMSAPPTSAYEIPGRGARAYLDIEAVIAAAKATGCDAVHPGYGFLSENSAAGAALRRGGDRLRRAVAGGARSVRRQGAGQGAGKTIAACPSSRAPAGRPALEEAKAFFASLGTAAPS